jgi:predicted nicotinamide N-methyase
MTGPITDPAAFIAANTRVLAPPHTPEMVLHLADDAVALWTLTEEELGALGLPPPFWAFAWAGGQALARYILDKPETAAGRRVLDVASGSGIVAIAAMKAGAAGAHACDIDPFAAAACALNARLNGVTVTAVTADPIGTAPEAELILVGDLFYERDLAARLLAWLEALAAAGKTVLIGDPGRSYLPQQALTPLAEYAVPVSRDLEDAEVKRTRVWTLRT